LVAVWFRATRGRYTPIADTAHPEKLSALFQLEVACRHALDALPDLPEETTDSLREPVQAVCEITESALDRLDPDWRALSGHDSS
jgi:hypothetical protein